MEDHHVERQAPGTDPHRKVELERAVCERDDDDVPDSERHQQCTGHPRGADPPRIPDGTTAARAIAGRRARPMFAPTAVRVAACTTSSFDTSSGIADWNGGMLAAVHAPRTKVSERMTHGVARPANASSEI